MVARYVFGYIDFQTQEPEDFATELVKRMPRAVRIALSQIHTNRAIAESVDYKKVDALQEALTFEAKKSDSITPQQIAIQNFTNLLEEYQPSWAKSAACKSTSSKEFFPKRGDSTKEAKEICLSCIVAQQCISYALANNERFGIWGGTSERDRRRLRRAISSSKKTKSFQPIIKVTQKMYALPIIERYFASNPIEGLKLDDSEWL